MKSFLS